MRSGSRPAVDIAPEECRPQLEEFAIQSERAAHRRTPRAFYPHVRLEPHVLARTGLASFRRELRTRSAAGAGARRSCGGTGWKNPPNLPDHLTHVLRLVGRMEHETAADFTAACVLPALAKMLQALRGKDNPFENVLLSVQTVLRNRFPEIPLAVLETEPLLKVLV